MPVGSIYGRSGKLRRTRKITSCYSCFPTLRGLLKNTVGSCIIFRGTATVSMFWCQRYEVCNKHYNGEPNFLKQILTVLEKLVKYLGSNTFQGLPQLSATHPTSLGALKSTPSLRHTKFSIDFPLITQLLKSPCKTSLVPWAIIWVPATQIRWMWSSLLISNLCSWRIRSNNSLLLEVPLK